MKTISVSVERSVLINVESLSPEQLATLTVSISENKDDIDSLCKEFNVKAKDTHYEAIVFENT